MRDLMLRGVRLIDPSGGLDLPSCDLLLSDGVVKRIGSSLPPSAGAAELERPGTVVAPAFLDVHCHLREPGQPWKERVANATAAAAAGGFGAVAAMANLHPAVDNVPRLRQVITKNRSWGRVPILQFAACTSALLGQDPADVEALVAAGAAGISDDGRNGMDHDTLARLLQRADALGIPLAVHPEDERVLATANEWSGSDPTAWSFRPPEAEEAAVASILAAVRETGSTSLHIQHLTTAGSVALVRSAKSEGLKVTAEVTPHHLMLDGLLRDPAQPERPLACNPPLRTRADRRALWEALLDGTIDAVASDHAPHELPSDPLQRRAAGFSGIQCVLSVLLLDEAAAANLPRLMEVLTVGPRLVMRRSAAT
ncbi:MAG: amidohydrolase family protein, partial [Candidatus Dormibacteria bacterium]